MLHEHIHEAIDELENRSTRNTRLKKQFNTFDVLIDLIAGESKIEPEDLKITEQDYRREIERIINNISDSDNPVSDFHSELSKLEDEIEDTHREYTILFPWNLTSTNYSGFDKPIESGGLTFNRTARQIWEKHTETAKEESTFDQFVNELPTQKNHTSPFTQQRIWKVTQEGGSPDYVLNRLTSALELLQGKITFATYFGMIPNIWRNTNWKYGTTQLQSPICYLILQDGEYFRYHTSYDFTPRRRFSLKGSKKRNFNKIYPMIPDISDDTDEIDRHLMTAFSAYYSAMSEPRPDRTLLDYWRCLEAATLTQDENYSANAPIKRGRAVKRPKSIRISDGRIEQIVEKRNNLVHKGEYPNITEGDLVHLKSLSEASIWFLMTDRQNYSFEEFKFFFEYGAKSEEQILQAKEQREKQIAEKREEIQSKEEEIGRIDQIVEWLEIDDN